MKRSSFTVLRSAVTGLEWAIPKPAVPMIAALLWSGCLLRAQDLPVPEGRRLRVIVADKYPAGNLLIGATTGSWGFTEPIGSIMDREFSYVTPENDFKQSVVRSNPDQWNWSRADAWLQHIIDNDQVLRIHGPISPQCAGWVKEDGRTAAELEQELDTFMTALCMRYNGAEGIEYLDVVNEIALSDGRWHHPKPGTDQWENPWLKIGQDSDPNQTPLYVKQAFAIASEHAPDLKLVLNNHCHPGTAGMEKVKETILYLRDLGYRVDALGWQAHVEVGWATEQNLRELGEVIDWCQSRNLEFHVTEFDAWIMNPYTQTLEGQAHTYKAIMDVLLEKLDTLTIGWNTWHITDAAGWKTERIPSLFDAHYEPKPAYYAFQLALEARGDYTTPYEVEFRVRNRRTGDPVEGCEIAYRASFRVLDAYTGSAVFSAGVTVDTTTKLTDQEGIAGFMLPMGSYAARVAKKGYAELYEEYVIRSDTVVTAELHKTHARVKFELENNGTHVQLTKRVANLFFRLSPGSMDAVDAHVIIRSDTARFSDGGISRFYNLEIDQEHSYPVLTANYPEYTGTVFLESDTTVTLSLEVPAGSISPPCIRASISCISRIPAGAFLQQCRLL